MIQLRDYQRKSAEEIKEILQKHNLAYLAGEIRTGKSLTSLFVAYEMGWRKICFITKKMAISSVKSDLQQSGLQFSLVEITNFEQAPNLHPIYDGYIIDEASSLGAFPKPGKYCQAIRKLIFTKKSPCILMSGTPTPESPSQIFHQFWISPFSPFQGYGHRTGEFYGWAREYVKVKKVMRNGFMTNDYRDADEKKIKEVTKHYMVSVSQVEAGFTSFVEEEVFYVDINKQLYALMKKLKDDKVYRLKSGDTIVADTPVRLQQICHQLSSGTVITGEEENRKYHILDESKAWFIKTKFAGQKLAIFYKFVSEGNILRKLFPNHTNDPQIFNSREDITFICQMTAGRMGVNVSTCDWLVMYNIDFSATTYFQIRGRMQTKDRTKASKLAWIFSKHGIEKHVLKAVTKKKDFTLDYFKRDFINSF